MRNSSSSERPELSVPTENRHAAPLEICDGLGGMIGVDEHQISVVGIGGPAAEPGEFGWIELRVQVALVGELRHGALELGAINRRRLASTSPRR